jgi:uncharacterized membrane protein YdbT with pleckstrin-like domain
MNGENDTPDPKPVAYDNQGRPLYAHPPTPDQIRAAQAATEPQLVQLTRPHAPQAPELSEDTLRKHADSKKKYPHLNLSEGEYVISAIRRHPIGLLSIWGVVGFFVLLVFVGLPLLATATGITATLGLSASAIAGLGMILLLLTVLFALGGIIATIVYNGNRFYLTNESVTQHIQTGLFSRKEQTISLVNIEDASFRQHGIVQSMLNYGSLRLSTQGDETTYRFNYVSNPQQQVALLNNAVEAFKMGRPVLED